MNTRAFRFQISLRSALALSALMALPFGGATVAHADDLVGVYIGAALGQAHVRARPSIPGAGTLGDLDMTHTAFKGMAGVRLLSFLGVEVTYMDFGKVSGMGGQQFSGPGIDTLVTSEEASQRGEAAFAVLYLPVPIIDVYVKAGLSRITTDFTSTYEEFIPGAGTCQIGHPNCSVLGIFTTTHDSTDTSFAYGAGLQWKLGSWAVRGEYERFDAAGANPTLFSIGMTYWVL
jgi:opacity protein-like surface antigen